MATRAGCDERTERRARVLAETLAEGRAALSRQAARHVASAADAEDALQIACVEFLRYYDGEPGERALAYLMVAVKHSAWAIGSAAWQRHRAAIELTTADVVEPGVARHAPLCGRPGPPERALARAEAGALAGAVAKLKPDQRTALSLLTLGYAYREIAVRQGWTATKVNRCLAEGRATLRLLMVESEAKSRGI